MSFMQSKEISAASAHTFRRNKMSVGTQIPVFCAHTRMAAICELRPQPVNPNKHPKEQVALLAKIINGNGWRNPIVVSTRSGYITKGHGRLEAAKLLGVECAPVDDQEYASEALELADVLADNRIAELSETDGAVLKDFLINLDSLTEDFDMDLTGFDAMELERVINFYRVDGDNDPTAEWKGMPGFEQDAIKPETWCILKFATVKDRDDFETLLGYKLQHKGTTYSAWFPETDFDGLGKNLRFAQEK
jgi:hypothetical protein